MSHPFDLLSPDVVLDAVEHVGYHSDARILALNSYENRVYQVGIEEQAPLIAKFYRPDRWTDQAIREEHLFALALAEQEVPVVPPMTIQGETLFRWAGFRFALFPRRGGRAPDSDNLDQMYRLGQLLGRLHAVGAAQAFVQRESLSFWNFGYEPLKVLLSGPFMPHRLHEPYAHTARTLLERIKEIWASVPFKPIRLHGDCHPGNILTREDQLLLVDLDDCRMGPAVQDLWMMLSGSRAEQQVQLAELIEGYQAFYDFDPRQLRLIESLRTLRMLHYSAWLATRWDDPAFPRSFPWFGTEAYWQEQLLTLEVQLEALNEDPLRLLN